MKIQNKKIAILIVLLALTLSACGKKHAQDDATPPLPEEPAVAQHQNDDLPDEEIIGDEMIITPTHEDGNGESEAFLAGYYKTTENVNLREGPSTDTTRFTTVLKGTIVSVTDSVGYGDDEWYLVDYKGQKGYMKAEFFTKTTDEPIPEEVEELPEEVLEEAADEPAAEETVELPEIVVENTTDAPIPTPSVVLPDPNTDKPIPEPPEDDDIIIRP